jgi:hypothetical protein
MGPLIALALAVGGGASGPKYGSGKGAVVGFIFFLVATAGPRGCLPY